MLYTLTLVSLGTYSGFKLTRIANSIDLLSLLSFRSQFLGYPICCCLVVVFVARGVAESCRRSCPAAMKACNVRSVAPLYSSVSLRGKTQALR